MFSNRHCNIGEEASVVVQKVKGTPLQVVTYFLLCAENYHWLILAPFLRWLKYSSHSGGGSHLSLVVARHSMSSAMPSSTTTPNSQSLGLCPHSYTLHTGSDQLINQAI